MYYRKYLTGSKLTLLAAALLILAACKKEENRSTPTAGVNVINAAVDLGLVRAGFKPGVLATATTAYGANTLYWLVAEKADPIRVAAVSDTTKFIYQGTAPLKSNGLYTLYLVGQTPNVEAVFTEENYPTFTTEQLAVRVVNLSPNSTPVNVTLSATPTVNEFSGLSYKQSSVFKTYAAPLTAVPANFTFQVRNSANVVLATYAFTAANITAARYKSVTLVLRGLVGGTGTNALTVSYIPNYF